MVRFGIAINATLFVTQGANILTKVTYRHFDWQLNHLLSASLRLNN